MSYSGKRLADIIVDEHLTTLEDGKYKFTLIVKGIKFIDFRIITSGMAVMISKKSHFLRLRASTRGANQRRFYRKLRSTMEKVCNGSRGCPYSRLTQCKLAGMDKTSEKTISVAEKIEESSLLGDEKIDPIQLRTSRYREEKNV